MSSLSQSTEFLGVEIGYSQGVLTPRLETESLVLGACLRTPEFDLVIDVGTGSGAIALSVASRYPGAQVCATDISLQALDIARANARVLRVEVDFRQGDLLSPFLEDAVFLSQVKQQRVLVIANLPYIPLGVSLPEDVVQHDPAIALWG